MKTQFHVFVVIGLSAIHGVCDAAQTVSVVSPAELENTDGPSFVTPVAFSVHYQQLYASSLFSALPQGGILKDVAFRVDAPSGSPWTDLKTGIQVTVSTFSQGSLSPIFAENIGPDAFRVIVASDTTILNSSWIGPFNPTLFGIAFGNAQGFHYDPSQGDLLVDVTGLSVPQLLDSYVGSKTTAVWQSAQDPNSPEGRLTSEGLVTLFSFTVPEPSAWALLALSFGALLFTRGSRLKPKEPNVTI